MTVLVGLTARAIQSYVFASNGLVDVIGASALVEELFEEERLLEDFGALDTDVLATGGGVTVLVVTNEERAREGARRFSLRRLRTVPGLEVSIVTVTRTPGRLATDLQQVHDKLSDRANDPPVDAALGTPAGVAACRTTGRAAAEMDPQFRVPLAPRALSARRRGLAEADWRGEQLPPEFGNLRWRFPTELDELGRSHSERSLIGVVHVDGAGIGAKAYQWGQKVKDADDDEVRNQYRAWSFGLRECVDRAWLAVVEAAKASLTPATAEAATSMVGLIGGLGFQLAESGRADTVALPVRRVVSSGDDLTFIAEGRVALALAVEAARAYADDLDGLGPVDASVGVALVHAHSPFIRAYELADQLCSRAKKGQSAAAEGLPHVDWHLGLLEPGQALSDAAGQPSMRPYPLVEPTEGISWDTFDRQILGTGERALRSQRWRRVEGKTRDLARRARSGSAAVAQALEEWQTVDPRLALPEVISPTGFVAESTTPLFDAVELVDRHQVPQALVTDDHTGATAELGAPA